VSYDFLVVMPRRPAPDTIEAFVEAAQVNVDLTGSFRTGANILVSKVDGDRRTIEVDGPVRVEIDDLEGAVAGTVRAPKWQVEIHLPGGFDESADGWAVDLAAHIARSADGVVYDPQREAIVWPTGITPRARGATSERIRTIELEWIVPWSRVPEDMPIRWLGIVREVWPEALPTRFGTYEPFQGRLDRDGDDRFAAEWRSVEQYPWGGLLFMKGAAPCFGGYIQIPDRRGDQVPCLSINLSLDARPFHRDPNATDRSVSRLAELCGAFRAIYGDATVRRNWILERGRLWSDGATEHWSSPLRRGGLFGGLPAVRPWVAWYGPEYAPLVRPWLADVATDREGGILVRHGLLPMDTDELAGAPRIPFELIGPIARTVPAIE
jgi:hypothetical protein